MEETNASREEKRPPRRRSIQLKLNAMVICSILAVALGLMAISYYVFCQRVDTKYDAALTHAAEACANNMDGRFISFFWSQINTEEFRTLRDKAAAAGDEQPIADWLRSRRGYLSQLAADDGDSTEFDGPDWSLMRDYEDILSLLLEIKDYFETDNAYFQYDDGETTYNIADVDENLFYIGTVEKPIPEFADYHGNVAIPPIDYRSEYGWLRTAMAPVMNFTTGEAVAIAGVDINMTDVMHERYSFLTQSLLFVAILLIIAIALCVVIMQRTTVRPLRELADAATRFAKEDRAFSKDDVIRLDIRSNDEIGDLYREIKSMEKRIVDYTEHLTQVTAEKERVSTELRTASGIQEAMLPSMFPAFPDRTDFDLYASMTPAKEVGGDFYDFFLIDRTHLALLIADVSDKGVPAALFMMSSKILLNYRAQMGGSPSEILQAVNTQICRGNTSRMFVTVWLGILDLESGVLTCSNAGHEYPFLRGGDGVFRVYRDRHGLVVGAMEQSRYRDYEIRMQPGDAVFVYTDGVPEASNEAGAFYGMERLESALNRLSGQNPRHILEGVKADVDAFTGEAKQFDDLTMLCLEYKGRSGADNQKPAGGTRSVQTAEP